MNTDKQIKKLLKLRKKATGGNLVNINRAISHLLAVKEKR